VEGERERRLRRREALGGCESANEVAVSVKVEAVRGLGLETLLLEAEWETVGSGDTGRALWKEFPVPLELTTMPMPLPSPWPFRSGVSGGESGPLTCSDPAGWFGPAGLSIVLVATHSMLRDVRVVEVISGAVSAKGL
jgi:hypothetical protein